MRRWAAARGRRWRRSSTALEAIKHGDYPAIAACFTEGIPRYIGRSRNTPPPTRKVEMIRNTVPHPFDPGRHTV